METDQEPSHDDVAVAPEGDIVETFKSETTVAFTQTTKSTHDSQQNIGDASNLQNSKPNLQETAATASTSTSSASAGNLSRRKNPSITHSIQPSVRTIFQRASKDRARILINKIVKGVILQKNLKVKQLRKRPRPRRPQKRMRETRSVAPLFKPLRLKSYDSLDSTGCSLCGHSCCARNC